MKPRGFTLVEMAVVLLVTTVLMGMFLKIGGAVQKLMQSREVADRMTLVETALMGYAMENGRFPCPARADLADDAPGAGADVCGPAIDGAYRGAVPWVTIGLLPDDVTDGAGQRFTYLVSQRGIEDATGAPLDSSTTSAGMQSQIRVDGVANSALFALISHQARGGGKTSRGDDYRLPGDAEFLAHEDEHANEAKREVFTAAGDDRVLVRSAKFVVAKLVASESVRSRPAVVRDDLRRWLGGYFSGAVVDYEALPGLGLSAPGIPVSSCLPTTCSCNSWGVSGVLELSGGEISQICTRYP